MERVVARFFLALCVVVATSIPTTNAVPMASFQQRALTQQNGLVSDVTEALVVSLSLSISGVACNTATYC